MKRLLIYLLLLSLTGFTSPGQSLSDIDTNKYMIRLPSHWKPGNKIWKILSDKMPTVCEEIMNKDLCGDNCNPRYTLELEIYEPVVTSYDYYCTNPTSSDPNRNWVFLVYYNFQSSFLLLNDKREVLARYIIVDTTESWHSRIMETVPMQREIKYRNNNTGLYTRVASNPSPRTQTTTSSNFVPVYIYRDIFDPVNYIRGNRERLYPTDPELFAIIDNKIRSW